MAENNSEAQGQNPSKDQPKEETNKQNVGSLQWHDDEYDEEGSDEGEEIGFGEDSYFQDSSKNNTPLVPNEESKSQAPTPGLKSEKSDLNTENLTTSQLAELESQGNQNQHR